MNKFYKLNVGFKPWWCEHFLDVYPSKHIETILEEEYWEDYYEEDVYPPYGYWWKEIKNLQYTQDYVYLEETEPNIPLYIKYITDEKIYYYYLYSKDKLTTVNKQGKSLYSCVYFIDKYMTIYFDKLQILFEKNPMVKFNRKYCVPWLKIDDTHYEINFVKQKELSSYINETNAELVRNKIFSIKAEELYAQLDLEPIVESDLKWLNEPCNTGRYRYIVLKSSALNNQNIVPIKINQTIFIIPIKDDDTLDKISNIDLTQQYMNKIILNESNFIGVFECDLPFSILYGLSLKDNKVLFKKDNYDVEYFEVPLNYYNKIILINYLNYNKGFYGKLKYLFQNTDKVIPETEIALLAPQYYREVYDNGSGNITNDLSKFIFKWSTEQPLIFNLYITLQFNSELGIAYNYGENTNTQLAFYDNTNTQISNISLPIGLVGSAATQYFANNLNTSLTSIQNRKLDQEQARRNKDFDISKGWLTTGEQIANTWINVAKPFAPSVLNWMIRPFNIGSAIVNTAIAATKQSLETAQQHFNYVNNQLRANRELTSQINNIHSSPNINLSNPFLKSVIPNEKDENNKYELFKHYAFELHPYDKKLIFAKLLDEGYIYNCVDRLNNFDVRKYMNILNIDPYMHYSHLLSVLKENDESLFNSPRDYDDFFIWLAKPKKIYKTNIIINVLDWKEKDYTHNIYIMNFPKPLPAANEPIDINTLNWSLPEWLPDYNYLKEYWNKKLAEQNKDEVLYFWYSKCLSEIKDLNNHLPIDLWNYIKFEIIENNFIKISVSENDYYKGEIVSPCKFWYIKTIENNKTKYYNTDLNIIKDTKIEKIYITKFKYQNPKDSIFYEAQLPIIIENEIKVYVNKIVFLEYDKYYKLYIKTVIKRGLGDPTVPIYLTNKTLPYEALIDDTWVNKYFIHFDLIDDEIVRVEPSESEPPTGAQGVVYRYMVKYNQDKVCYTEEHFNIYYDSEN